MKIDRCSHINNEFFYSVSHEIEVYVARCIHHLSLLIALQNKMLDVTTDRNRHTFDNTYDPETGMLYEKCHA